MYLSKIKKFLKKNINSFKDYKIYKKNLKNINIKHSLTTKPKIAFLIAYPETWTSLQTIYKSCLDNNLETIIICVPKSKNHDDDYIINDQKDNLAWEALKKEKNSVNAYLGKDKWFNLKDFQPDYVFYSRPYNNQYPKLYQSNVVSNYSKICLVPYGYNIGKIRLGSLNWLVTYNAQFMLETYLFFASDIFSLKKIKRKYFIPYLTKSNKYKYLGYPRFDLLSDLIMQDELKERITITWMPRWDFRKDRQNSSNFLNYYQDFINYVKHHKQINFIFRPHPLMFAELIKRNILTKKEIDKIKTTLHSFNNLEFDTNSNYLKTIQKTDILIADMTSLLMEFFITGKPIIYCNNTKGLEKNAQLMIKSLYNTNNWLEIESVIKQIIDNNDYKKEKRLETIKSIIKEEKGKSGNMIVKHILDDYYKTN